MIPKKIYQIGIQKSPYEDAWRTLNPDYEYVMYGDNQCAKIIQELNNSRALAAYNRVRVGAMRADICRLALLYKHGGIYADTDVVPYKSLNSIMRDDASIISTEYSSFEFIMSVPSHPFIGFALNRSANLIFDEIERCRRQNRCCTGAHSCIIEVTGPRAYFQSIVRAGIAYGCTNKRWVPSRASCANASSTAVRNIFKCRDMGERHNMYKTTFCGIARHADCRNSGIGQRCGKKHYKNQRNFYFY